MNPDYITDAMQAKASLEWFACDEDGAIAWFESGGYAPLPESVRVSDRDRNDSIQLVKQLDPCTTSIRYPDLFTRDGHGISADSYDFFVSFSCRGIYTYEIPSDDAKSAPYECITAPVAPVHVDQLPPKLSVIIARTKLPCRFAETQQLPLGLAHKAEPFVLSRKQQTAKNLQKLDRHERLSCDESCKLLQSQLRLEKGSIPPLPDTRPQFDDETVYGVRFFRTRVGNDESFGLKLKASDPDSKWDREEYHLENLTLPRTFFGRSEISCISFKNTDLSESTLCWNDFIEVDFTDADLSGSDLRAALFTRTIFVRANLRNADLRHSTFKECGFAGADMSAAKLTHAQREVLPLSDEQKRVIDWQESAGDEPPGG